MAGVTQKMLLIQMLQSSYLIFTLVNGNNKSIDSMENETMKTESDDKKDNSSPPVIPMRKSKIRKFLEASTQTEAIGFPGCICCCKCGGNKRNTE